MTDARSVGQHAEHLASDLDGDLDVGAVGGGGIAAVKSPSQQICRPRTPTKPRTPTNSLTLTKPRSLAQVQSDFGGMPAATVDVPGLSDVASAEYGVLRCTGSGVVCAFFACLALAARLRVSTMMAKAIGP